MRVALVADEDPGWGGIGTYTGVMGKGLQTLGHDVHLVLRGWEEPEAETLEGLTVHRVSVPEPSWSRGTVAAVSRLYGTRESLIFSARVARVLAQIRPDVVEAPEFHGAGLVVALRTRLQRRAPAVVTRLHTPSFLTARLAQERPDLDLRAAEVLEAASVHSARSVTSPSEALAGAVRRRWRVPAGRVCVIPNPIDEDLFAPGREDVEIPGRILVVGRVERHKGQDLLVEALPAIRRSVPHAHLSIIGADGGMAEQLTRRARALQVSDAVGIEGPRSREELPSAYRSASVCVVPSRFDAFPYSCIEAMACGRAVVAARVGGLPEAIADQTDGLLVAPENPAALANAVTRLLLDAAQRRRLGQAARARMTSCFATKPVATRIAEHYAELTR